MQFHSILSLSPERPSPINVNLNGARWSVRSALGASFHTTWPPSVSVESFIRCNGLTDGQYQYDRLHASGYLSSEPATDGALVPLEQIQKRLKKWEMKGFYDQLNSFAQYGPTYRRLLSCYHGMASGSEEYLVEIRGEDGDLEK